MKSKEEDPREELVLRLLEYKKFKAFTDTLRQRERDWSRVYWKLPEVISFARKDEVLDLIPSELNRVYLELMDKNRKKMNPNVSGMTRIIQHEKVSMKSKMREIIRALIKNSKVRFTELFSFRTKSPTDIVTGFMAVLELTKLKKVKPHRATFVRLYQ
jgi:segregation and condensation protein A